MAIARAISLRGRIEQQLESTFRSACGTLIVLTPVPSVSSLLS
jgi:hypothetical protein